MHPRLEEIRLLHESLKDEIIETPIISGDLLSREIPIPDSTISLKLELFQKTGSFKIRGAVALMRTLSPAQQKNGVAAFSGGNHAIAVSYAANILGISAKVVMPRSADTSKFVRCKNLGAEVFLVNERADAPILAMQIAKEEDRALIPPFDHQKIIEGTATLGYELSQQIPDLDILFLPIGGGGLAAGVSCAIKQLKPACSIIGVQPESANAMYRSLKSGTPEHNYNVDTIADSLCPPHVGNYTFAICKAFLDDILLVKEADIKMAMRLLYDKYDLMVEGAGATALAGLISSKKDIFEGKNIGIMISGSNIDQEIFDKNCSFTK